MNNYKDLKDFKTAKYTLYVYKLDGMSKPLYSLYRKQYISITMTFEWVYVKSFNSKYEYQMYIDLLGLTEIEKLEYRSKIYAIYYE